MPLHPRGLGSCLLILALGGGFGPLPAADDPAGAPLTSAAAVRRLQPEEAGRGHPVRLVGHIAIVSRLRDALVLLDETEGIYVELPQPAAGNLKPGDRLEVAGVTGPGDFAPMVRASRILRLGPGTLPPPQRVTIGELGAGGFDAAWVELEGIVRACVRTPVRNLPQPRATAPPRPGGGETVTTDSWQLTFAQGDHQLAVQVNGPLEPAELEDARVRLRGVVFNVHNTNRQFIRASLQVADRSMIDVLKPPPTDPFALPLQHVGEILRFSPTGFTGHRVRVRGVVTGHRDRHTLWLREGNRGMRVASRQEGTLRPGDEVEVVGFPDHDGYTPSLRDALFRRVATGLPPVPEFIANPEEISRQDANLVEVEARLDEVRRTPEGLQLTLGWQGLPVKVQLLRGEDRAEELDWAPGSRVRMAGICVLGQEGFSPPTGLWVAGDVELLLRGPEDLTVVQAAPWLTTRRALVIVVSVAVLSVLALVVVAVLARRQIRQREEARKLAEVEFSAMLAERNRLAREIHDTLAQNLNAVSMQLELARNSAKSGAVETVVPFVATAHQIVRTCLAEARESIWNMRSHALERSDLIGALRGVAEHLSAGRPGTVRTRVEGRPRRVAPVIENHLLRIGQEAVANALQHAQARTIDVVLSFEEPALRLVVEDDGSGFDPAATPRADGHFGLRGMRERVEQMGGTLQIGPGRTGGTRVEVRVDSVA